MCWPSEAVIAEADQVGTAGVIAVVLAAVREATVDVLADSVEETPVGVREDSVGDREALAVVPVDLVAIAVVLAEVGQAVIRAVDPVALVASWTPMAMAELIKVKSIGFPRECETA